MDILDKLLAFSQISAGLNVKCKLQGEWRLDNPPHSGQAVAHIITQGSAYLHHNGQTVSLKQGDIVFFPKSTAHILSDRAEAGTASFDIRHSTQGGFTLKQIGNLQSECEMFCLHFYYDRYSQLMESLPEPLVLQASKPLQAMIELLQQEAGKPNLAAVSVVNALALVVLTMILRQHLADADNAFFGILKGWQEPRLRPLLKAILLAPEQGWQLDEMAAAAHLSRSQLIRLFNKYLGVSPHAFVHNVRLQKAAMLLKSQADSVLAVALSCGFQSEPHFITAFKKHYGETPNHYRQGGNEKG